MARVGNVLLTASIFLTCLCTSWCNYAQSFDKLEETKNTGVHPVLENSPSISWMYENSVVPLHRERRDAGKQASNYVLKERNLIDEDECRGDIKRLCGTLPAESDDLTVLECIQTLKVTFFALLMNMTVMQCLFNFRQMT
jgi:uncharacterized membrane protein YkgB